MRFGFWGPLFEDGLSSPGFRGFLVRCWAIFFALRRSRQVPPLSLVSGLIMFVSPMAKLRSKPSSAILELMTNFWFCLDVWEVFWLLGAAKPGCFFSMGPAAEGNFLGPVCFRALSMCPIFLFG